MQLSIIIPVYNAEKTIQRTIHSLKKLDNCKQKSEIIFVNDGSTDNTKKIIDAYISENNIKNIILLNKENGGSATARNAGLEISKGQWVFFLDADDELLFEPLYWINKYPEKTAVGFSVVYYKNKSRYFKLKPPKISNDNFLDILTSRNPFSPSSLIFKKDKLAHMFDPGFSFLEDWLFWIMNPKVCHDMVAIKSITSVKFHIHGNNKTSDQNQNGIYRIKIAEEVFKKYNGKLSKKQKNNLIIQKNIGLIQQAIRPLSLFSLGFPCDFILFIKLVIYMLFQRFSEKLGPYAVSGKE